MLNATGPAELISCLANLRMRSAVALPLARETLLGTFLGRDFDGKTFILILTLIGLKIQ